MQHGHLRQAAAARADAPGLVGAGQRFGIGHSASGDQIAVEVKTAHAFVDVEKLGGCDLAFLECLQPVLHAHVVERPAREAGEGVAAHAVDIDVVHRAARTGRVGQRVVDLAGVVQAARRVDRAVRGQHGIAVAGVPAGAGVLQVALEGAPRSVAGRLAHKVAVEQAAIRHRQRGAKDVREGRVGHDAVEDAGVVLRDQHLLNGAARTAHADHPARHAVGLGDVLADAHRGLGGQGVVDVDLVDVQAGHHIGKAALQRLDALGVGGIGLEDIGDGIAALVVLGRRGFTKTEHDALVPAGAVELARGLRIVQHSDAVDRAVEGARLDAHDERHRLAIQRGGRAQIRRARAERVGERLACTGGGEVMPLKTGGHRAVGVERRAQAGFGGTALERRHARPRKHGCIGRMVDHGQLALGLGRCRLQTELVVAQAKAADQAAQALAAVDGR